MLIVFPSVFSGTQLARVLLISTPNQAEAALQDGLQLFVEQCAGATGVARTAVNES